MGLKSNMADFYETGARYWKEERLNTDSVLQSNQKPALPEPGLSVSITMKKNISVV